MYHMKSDKNQFLTDQKKRTEIYCTFNDTHVYIKYTNMAHYSRSGNNLNITQEI